MKLWLPLGIVFYLLLVGAGMALAQEEPAEATPPPPPETPPPPEPVQEGAAVQKPKINNLPFNMYGLSGLMLTTSTRTLRPMQFEAGIGFTMEDSSTPEYSRREYMFLGTVGIPGGLEFGLRVPYIEHNLLVDPRYNNLGVLVREYKNEDFASMGDFEGMIKWGFVEQHYFLPAFALGLGGIAPTGDHARETGDVKNYGIKIMLAMGLEINDLAFTDYAFAIMADGVLVLQDMGLDDREYEEKHGLVHAGMIFPLHPRNFVEFMVEYEGVLMHGTTNGEDTNGIIASLRFVTNHFNLTAGAEYTFKEDPDFDDTYRYLANFSYTYF